MDSMKKKKLIDNSLTYGLVIACWAVVQIMMATGHMTSLMKGLLVPLCMYVILAVSLNLTVGILGELSLGHAGFMCVGAFSGAFFTKLTAEAIPNLQVRFILALIIGALVAALFGILIGIPVLRLRGDYLAIVTLAFGEIIKNVINVLYVGADANGIHIAMKKADLNLQEGGQVIIEGAKGITGTPKAATFAIGIILVLLTLFIVLNLMNSRSGRAIMPSATTASPRSPWESTLQNTS